MTSLCLIRHGQTAWNIEGRIQGQSDIPLDEFGAGQAYNLASYVLLFKHFDAIYSSPLLRALDTAHIIKKDRQLDIVLDDRLKERHYGLWQEMLDSEVKEKYPITRNSNWRLCGPPGGEAQSSLVIRAASFIEEILQRHIGGKQIVIVSHECLLAAMLGYILKMPLEMHQTLRWSNCGHVWVEYINGHPRLAFQ